MGGRLLLMAASVLAMALAGCSNRDRTLAPAEHTTQSVDLDKSEKVDVDLRMGAGELDVQGGSAKLMDADFTYAPAAMKPLVRYMPGAVRGRLTIEEPNRIDVGWNGPYQWSLRFNDKIPMDLTAHLGAGNVEMRLGSLALRGIEIHMGVGNLDLDLRGEPTHDYDVEIRGGVGNATLYLPASANIIAEAKGGIGNIEGRGLEKHNGEWTNTPRAGAKANVHLDIHGGVGNISLIAN